MSNHHFVLFGKGEYAGWWLRISSLAELVEYHDAHNSRYGKAFQNIVEGKGFLPAQYHPRAEHGLCPI